MDSMHMDLMPMNSMYMDSMHWIFNLFKMNIVADSR